MSTGKFCTRTLSLRPSRTPVLQAACQHRIGHPKPRQPLPRTGLIVENSGRRRIDEIENFETWYDDHANVEGTISRIGDAATSQFSVLPRLNDSSTFTTVTQRIKVPVDIKRGHGRLQPGMMVEIYVDDGTAEGFWSWLP